MTLAPGSFARDAHSRALSVAVLASLALHALLFVLFPLFDPAAREAVSRVPIVARLLPAPAAPEAPAPAPAPSAEAAPEPPEPAAAREPPPAPPKREAPPLERLSRPAPTPAPPAEARPEPTPALAAVAPEPRAAETPAPPRAAAPVEARAPERAARPPAAAPPAASAALKTTPAASAPGAPPPAPAAPDAGTLAQYRLALIASAARFKRYPRAALDNNWEGRAEVRMAIGAGGALASLEVRASSGHEVLDRQALDMLREASRNTPLPAALRGRAFDIDIPVIFDLRDPGA